MWRDELGLLDKLPHNEEYRVNDDQYVRREEACNAEAGRVSERAVAEEEADEAFADESEPGRVGLEVAAIGERFAVEALDFAGFVEAEVGDRYADVVDDA